MPRPDLERLRRAIRDLHGSDSVWAEAVPVREVFEGRVAWEGEVQVFRLLSHSTAERCYAWASPAEPKPRIYAVLHIPPVDSPAAAVRASIASNYRIDHE